MTGAIDSHIHLDRYDESERKKIINSLENNNIQGLIAVSNDLKSLKKLMKIASHNQFVKPCAGYHPEQELHNLLQKHEYDRAHCQSAKTYYNTLELMVKKGYMISINTDIIYKERIQELVKFDPLDLMMVETDGPWRYEHLDKVMTPPKMLYDTI